MRDPRGFHSSAPAINRYLERKLGNPEHRRRFEEADRAWAESVPGGDPLLRGRRGHPGPYLVAGGQAGERDAGYQPRHVRLVDPQDAGSLNLCEPALLDGRVDQVGNDRMLITYRDPQHPDLAPAYDVVSTIQYLPEDQSMALNMAGVKQVADITLASFERLERAVGLPRPGRLAHEARRTVQQALETWPAALPDLPMEDGHKEVILNRLRTLPITRL